eukprot:scaffold250880_cov30-Tisochrysis_lutea.AAC.1
MPSEACDPGRAASARSADRNAESVEEFRLALAAVMKMCRRCAHRMAEVPAGGEILRAWKMS